LADTVSGVAADHCWQKDNMTKIQNSKLRSYLTLEVTLETNHAVWENLPAFVSAVEEFTAIIPEIQALAQTQASREGAANEKSNALESLGEAAFEVGAAVHAYAVTTQDFALEGRVDFSRSTIVYGRESSVLARVRDIHAAATTQLANLADYGITAAKLTAFKKKIDAFGATMPKPRQQIAAGSAATTNLKGQFRAADAILNDRLDNLVCQFKNSAPDFFNAYQTARSVVDSGSTRKSTPPPAPQPA